MTQREQKHGIRSRLRKSWWLAIPLGGLTIFGLGCIDGPLGALLSIFLLFLGVNPTGNFGNVNSTDYGKVKFNLVQMQEDGSNATASDNEEDVVIDVTDPPGTKATVDKVDSKPSYDKGSFALLIDSSGSMEKEYNSGVCDLCPYDASRRRVEAAKILANEVLSRSKESRIAVYEFDPNADENRSSGMGDVSVVSELVGYTSDFDAIAAGADKTTSDGGTYIYDSVLEMLGGMDTEVKETFQTTEVNKAIVIITDGEDTESLATLSEVINRAQQLDIPIHVIGLGKAADNYKELYNTTDENTDLIRDLQKLAGETGGFYASVSSDQDLEELGENIGVALAEGHDEVTVTLDPVPEPGTVVKGTVATPNSFASVPWSFVAP